LITAAVGFSFNLSGWQLFPVQWLVFAFSFLAGWKIGWDGIIAALIVLYVVSDHGLGVAFSKSACARDIGAIR
jgi:hypothetical protein